MLFQMQSFSSRNDQIKETASGTAYVYLCMLMCTALHKNGQFQFPDVLATDTHLESFLFSGI